MSKSRLVLVLRLIGRESSASLFNQSESEVKKNQSKHNSMKHLATSLDNCGLKLYAANFKFDSKFHMSKVLFTKNMAHAK